MGATILVVDDDMDAVRLLQENLEMEGHSVLKGFDGQMALQLAQAHQPDLIVMDVQMPMTHGIKALEFMRRIPATRDIPIILLSGAPSQMIYAAVETATRTFFIKKPVDLDSLNSLVKHVLQQYTATR